MSLAPMVVQAQQVYRISILPRYYPEKLTAMITPLANYLSRETGLEIRPVLTKNFAEYEEKIRDGAIDIGYQNPLVYINVAASHEAVATAVKGEGGEKFRGIIIARPEAPITKFQELRHKKIMIVSKTSAGGYLSQKLTLAEHGLDVARDCEIEEAAENRQENVIISVSIGDVDAGFIRESALHAADKYIMPGSIRVVAECDWLPNWALSLSRSMPAKHRKKIVSALLALGEESAEIKAMGLDGFVPADDAKYDVMRKITGRKKGR
ncbi:MAG: phosphate/phosphite/phosphonate ABC transporter substrate-binding protein [Desulfobulbaceae bacterium]|nr:phosphate/phosphite/phosphonate ABC transporter substrate-binding protein [Desulfobulbaceae bacterium]